MSNLMTHALNELRIAYAPAPAGSSQDEPDYGNEHIPNAVLELIKVLSQQGHSGGSIGVTIDLFTQLANFKPLGPLTGVDAEWFLHDEMGPPFLYQNKRAGDVFKTAENAQAWYLNAVIFVTQNGEHLEINSGVKCGDGKLLISRQYIKSFPFTPKTFYVDVIETEIAKDDWVYAIKEMEQLKPVFEYYDRYEREPRK